MKKSIKLTAATVMALSAVTPVAAFAAETPAVKDGFYTADGFISLVDFAKKTKAEKKAFIVANITKSLVVVQGGKVYDLTKSEVQNATASQIESLGKTPAQYTAETNNELKETGITPVTPVGTLAVESVSAINLTKVTVKFNTAVDAVTADNFSIPGLTVASATLSEDKKTVTLSVTGTEVSKSYEVTVKNVKINATVQPELKKSFTAPTQNQLFNSTIEFKKEKLIADGADSTLVTFTLKDAEGNILKDAQNVEVAFSTTFGNFGEKRVTVQNGVATALLNSETLTSDKTAEVTVQVVEAQDKNLYGYKQTNTILMTPDPGTAGEVTTGALVSNAEAFQADRVILYFNKAVKVEDFVYASGNNKGKIDPTKAEITVKTGVNNDLTGGKTVNVAGLLPVAGNDKALQLVLDTDTPITVASTFPLIDNANVKVDFNDKRGSVSVPSTKAFKITDARTPALLNVTREGLKTLKVEFSEAVDKATAEKLVNWTIDGKLLNDASYGASAPATATVGTFNPSTGSDTRHVVTITLGKDATGKQIYLKSGKHSIQGANIGDWAVNTDPTNVMNTQTLDFEVPVDNAAPTATVEVQSPEQFALTFDKDLNESTLSTTEVKLQKYNTTTATWENVVNPGIAFTNISENGGSNKFLVETTNDWTQVYRTAATNKNYYNDSYRLQVVKDKVSAASNGVKNVEINLPLGGALTSPDVLSPTITKIAETTGKTVGTSYDVTLSEPVKLNVIANTEGETRAETQTALPVPTAQFIKKDNSVTIDANIATSFVDKEEKILRVTPTTELGAGEWTLVVRSISDDVGNTVASATKDFTVTKTTTSTNFKVSWALADWDTDRVLSDDTAQGTNRTNDADKTADYVFVKFNKAVALTGDFKNVLKTSNYTINGQALPLGSQIISNISGYDDMDQVVDSITIKLPQGTITDPTTTVINISSNLESAVGEVITNPGEKKLPFNIDVATAVKTVSTLDELKAAIANDEVRDIKLGANISLGTTDLTIDRVVNLDLNGKTITGNVSVVTTVGGKIDFITTGGASSITGTLTVDTPNADFTVGAGVTVNGLTTVKDVASKTFINNGTLNGVAIQDSNGTSLTNNGLIIAPVGGSAVTVDTTGNVTLGGTIPTVNIVKPATVTVAPATVINTLTVASTAPAARINIQPATTGTTAGTVQALTVSAQNVVLSNQGTPVAPVITGTGSVSSADVTAPLVTALTIGNAATVTGGSTAEIDLAGYASNLTAGTIAVNEASTLSITSVEGVSLGGLTTSKTLANGSNTITLADLGLTSRDQGAAGVSIATLQSLAGTDKVLTASGTLTDTSGNITAVQLKIFVASAVPTVSSVAISSVNKSINAVVNEANKTITFAGVAATDKFTSGTVVLSGPTTVTTNVNSISLKVEPTTNFVSLLNTVFNAGGDVTGATLLGLNGKTITFTNGGSSTTYTVNVTN